MLNATVSLGLPWAVLWGGEEGWVCSQAETKGLCSICPVPKGAGTSVQHPCLWLQRGASLTGLSPELQLLLRAELCHGVMGKEGSAKHEGMALSTGKLDTHILTVLLEEKSWGQKGLSSSSLVHFCPEAICLTQWSLHASSKICLSQHCGGFQHCSCVCMVWL